MTENKITLVTNAPPCAVDGAPGPVSAACGGGGGGGGGEPLPLHCGASTRCYRLLDEEVRASLKRRQRTGLTRQLMSGADTHGSAPTSPRSASEPDTP